MFKRVSLNVDFKLHETIFLSFVLTKIIRSVGQSVGQPVDTYFI